MKPWRVYVRHFSGGRTRDVFISSHGSGHEAEQAMLKEIGKATWQMGKMEVFATQGALPAPKVLIRS